jgi:hypothetical protein
MMNDERIVIDFHAKEDSALYDERTIWEMYVFHKKQFVPNHRAYLDFKTSKKIHDIQHETVVKIRNLIKENLDKITIITEEDMKKYKVK